MARTKLVAKKTTRTRQRGVIAGVTGFKCK